MTAKATNRPLSRVPFFLTMLYMAFEYGRPQDKFGVIGALRPQLILSILLLLSLIANVRRLPRAASPQTTRLILMMVLLALHVPFAANSGRALIPTQGFLLYLIVDVSLILYVDSVQRLRTLMNLWVCLMVYQSINGIVYGGAAGSSFLQDENDFCLLMVMMLPFGVFLSFDETNPRRKLLYLFATMLCLASIVASFSRGGFVGLLVVAFVVWLESSRKVLLLVSAVVLLAIVANLSISHTGTAKPDSTFWDEMTTIVSEDEEDYNKDSRKALWQAGWEMFKDHPLGVGPQNFPVFLPDYQSMFFGEKNMWGKQAHSIWFTLLPELGVPGLILFVSLLFANIRDLRFLKGIRPRERQPYRLVHYLALALIASIAGFLASGSFISVLYYPHYWYLTAMIVAIKKITNESETNVSA